MVDQFDSLKKDIDDLSFENQTLRKDLQECTRMLKDYQERDIAHSHRESARAEEDKVVAKDLERKLREIEIEHEKLKQDYERVQSMKGAYNADKKAFVDRINELEGNLSTKEQERSGLQSRIQ